MTNPLWTQGLMSKKRSLPALTRRHHSERCDMEQEELLRNLCQYACDALTFEERRSIPLDKWYGWVKEHFIPIPKSELEVGKEYNGVCRNASKATWDGTVFHYTRTKFGFSYDEEINHYEDDDGYDLFVPIKEI